MKKIYIVVLLLLASALTTQAFAHNGEEVHVKAKAPEKALTIFSAKSILRDALGSHEMDGITQVYAVTPTGIRTIVHDYKGDEVYTIEFPFANIKNYEWETDLTLVLTAKEKGKISRKEGDKVSAHTWSEWTLIFKPNTNKERVAAALELLAVAGK